MKGDREMSHTRSALASIIRAHFKDKPQEKQQFILKIKEKIHANDVSRMFDALPNMPVLQNLNLPLIDKIVVREFLEPFQDIVIGNKGAELSEKTKGRIRDWVKSIIIYGCDDFLDDVGCLKIDLLQVLDCRNEKIDAACVMMAYLSNVFPYVVHLLGTSRMIQYPCFAAVNQYLNQQCGALTKEVFHRRGFSDIDKFMYDYDRPITIVAGGIAAIGVVAAVGSALFSAVKNAGTPEERVQSISMRRPS